MTKSSLLKFGILWLVVLSICATISWPRWRNLDPKALPRDFPVVQVWKEKNSNIYDATLLDYYANIYYPKSIGSPQQRLNCTFKIPINQVTELRRKIRSYTEKGLLSKDKNDFTVTSRKDGTQEVTVTKQCGREKFASTTVARYVTNGKTIEPVAIKVIVSPVVPVAIAVFPSFLVSAVLWGIALMIREVFPKRSNGRF